MSKFGPQTLSHSSWSNYFSTTPVILFYVTRKVFCGKALTSLQIPFFRNSSSRRQVNYSSGLYELSKSNRYDNIFSLFFNCPVVCSVYWSWLVFNNSRIGVLNSLGNFNSPDDFTFMSADYGVVLHRRLTLDYEGNIRLYSWEEKGQTRVVSWQAIQRPCLIDGACGANSLWSWSRLQQKWARLSAVIPCWLLRVWC